MFVYVVTCADGSVYTGITTDLTRRLHEHNHTVRGAKYTRARRPVTLLASIQVPDRSAALKLEAKIKKMSRKQKLEWINENMEKAA